MPGSTSGTVSTSTAGKPTIGIAMNTAADGDPCEVLLCGFAKNA